MKKAFTLFICTFFIITLAGCNKEATVKKTYNDCFRTYYEMSDGTWKCDDRSYRYRLEISGRLPNAAKDSTFVYLSDLESISFDRAYKSAGLSSFSGDYFSPEDAILVELY